MTLAGPRPVVQPLARGVHRLRVGATDGRHRLLDAAWLWKPEEHWEERAGTYKLTRLVEQPDGALEVEVRAGPDGAEPGAAVAGK